MFIIVTVAITIVAGALLMILRCRKSKNTKSCEIDVEKCTQSLQTDVTTSRVDQEHLQLLDVSQSMQPVKALAQTPQPLILQNNVTVIDELSQQDILLPNMTQTST